MMTFFIIKYKIGLNASFKNLFKITKAFITRIPINNRIIYKYLYNVLYIVRKIFIMHLWKVAGALHKLKGILLKTKAPNGQVNIVLS